MKKLFILAAGAVLAIFVLSTAHASKHYSSEGNGATTAVAPPILPTMLAAKHTSDLAKSLVKDYNHYYHKVQVKFGSNAPGRNIVRWGMANGSSATATDVKLSMVVLKNMLAPPVAIQPGYAGDQALATANASSVVAGAAQMTAVPTTPASGTVISCVIRAESGGNPMATNGQYSGIGQWSASAWAQDGGTRYASSPTGASYAQQYQVLQSEGAAIQSQQAQYDGCP